MKNLLLLLIVFGTYTISSQSRQETKKEILKLRREGDNLSKEVNHSSWYCKSYFPDWHNFNFRNVRVYSQPKTVIEAEKLITEYQKDIRLLQNLKKQYLRPNGELSTYNGAVQNLSNLKNKIRLLEKEIEEYPYPIVWGNGKGKCSDIIQRIDDKIRELESSLRNYQGLKQELENNISKNSNSSNTYSNNNNYNSGNYNTTNTNSNNNINSSNTNSNSNSLNNQNTENKKTDYQIKMDNLKRKQQYEKEKIEIIGNAAVDLTKTIIASGIFNSDPKARERRRELRAEKKIRREKDRVEYGKRIDIKKEKLKHFNGILDPLFSEIYEIDKRKIGKDVFSFSNRTPILETAPYKFTIKSNWKIINSSSFDDSGKKLNFKDQMKAMKIRNENILKKNTIFIENSYGYKNKNNFSGLKYKYAYPFRNGKAVVINKEEKGLIINEEFQDITELTLSKNLYELFIIDNNIIEMKKRVNFNNFHYLNFYHFTKKLIKEKKQVEALYLSKFLSKKYPSNSNYFMLRGSILLNYFNKKIEAKEMFEECLEIDSNNKKCRNYLNGI